MTGTPTITAVVQEGPAGSSAIAAGSRGTVRAGAEVLAAGGNAADAALAAMLASAVAEPSLTSMGGGGFLLVRLPDGRATVVDFFVDTPGLGSLPRRPSAFIPVSLQYPGTIQTFHVGAGSIAVPGCLAGLLDAHAAFGRLALADVVAPARSMAADGWPVEPMQLDILRLVRDIFMASPEGRALLHRPDGTPLQAGDPARLPDYAATLGMIADGTIASMASPALTQPILETMAQAGGMITAEDLQRYQVFHRSPIALHRNGSDILTNPTPSFGGPIIVDALARTEQLDGSAGAWREATHNLLRATEFYRRAELGTATVRSQQGTTHLSVVDGDGMVASLTTSNGSGSGTWVDSLGLHLNNMLGEEDLNPQGFHAVPPGLRIGSMMSPTVVRRDDGTLLAMGTGGSERIRSALFEVLLRTVDLGMSAAESIVAPRLHPKAAAVEVEPGWPSDVVDALREDLSVNIWPHAEVFFGGVHAVMRRPDGSVQAVGDPRRCGATAIVTADRTIVEPP
jgi:gamma-glutamyltranspeptidase/glutathione hydrolase